MDLGEPTRLIYGSVSLPRSKRVACRHQAAAQFDDDINHSLGAALPQGRQRRSRQGRRLQTAQICGAHHDSLLRCCRRRTSPCAGRSPSWGKRGLKVDCRSVWEFVRREKLNFKKDADRSRAKPPRRCAASRRRSFARQALRRALCHWPIGACWPQGIPWTSHNTSRQQCLRQAAQCRALIGTPTAVLADIADSVGKQTLSETERRALADR